MVGWGGGGGGGGTATSIFRVEDRDNVFFSPEMSVLIVPHYTTLQGRLRCTSAYWLMM